MKKIIICLLFCVVYFLPQKALADTINVNNYLELAKTYNVNTLNELKQRPYIGVPFNTVKKSSEPYIIVFADFEDIVTATKYMNNAYYVYTNLQGDYGFTAFNTKRPENQALMKQFRVKTVPYAYITNPKQNKVLPIKSTIYDNPQRLVHLLKAYLPETR